MTRWWRTVRSVSPWRQTRGVHAPALLHCLCTLSGPGAKKAKSGQPAGLLCVFDKLLALSELWFAYLQNSGT